MPKLQIACNTLVADGMVVETDSPRVTEAAPGRPRVPAHQPPARLPDLRPGRRVQAAGLLHGLRPLRSRGSRSTRRCDKGKAIPIGPHVMLDQERCILCTRCVRFCDEVTEAPASWASSSAATTPSIDAGRRQAARQPVLDEHRRHLPGRRADQPRLPLPGPRLVPRHVAVGLHRLRRPAATSTSTTATAASTASSPAPQPRRQRLLDVRRGPPHLAPQPGRPPPGRQLRTQRRRIRRHEPVRRGRGRGRGAEGGVEAGRAAFGVRFAGRRFPRARDRRAPRRQSRASSRPRARRPSRTTASSSPPTASRTARGSWPSAFARKRPLRPVPGPPWCCAPTSSRSTRPRGARSWRGGTETLVISDNVGKTMAYADHVLAIGSHFEAPGSFVNKAGHLQVFQASVAAPGRAIAGWEALANLLAALGGQRYETVDEVFTALCVALGLGAGRTHDAVTGGGTPLASWKGGGECIAGQRVGVRDALTFRTSRFTSASTTSPRIRADVVVRVRVPSSSQVPLAFARVAVADATRVVSMCVHTHVRTHSAQRSASYRQPRGASRVSTGNSRTNNPPCETASRVLREKR